MAGIKISNLPAAPSALLTDVFPVDQLPGPITYKESNSQLITLFKTTGEALTRTNDTNVTMTLTGSPTTALLNATNMMLDWSGQLAVPRGGTGNSTFTAYSVICAGTTATGAFQNVVGLGSAGEQLTSNGAGMLPTWQPSSTVTPSALTRVDDTNVTLTLGGTPTTALLQAVSITAGWTGVLSGTRGGTGVNNGASTITLGGSLTTSGAFASTFTMTGITSVTFPTSGTLATTSQLLTSPLTTKGDIWVWSTTNDRLPVATGDGKILQVSAAASTGLAYSTPTYPSASGSSGTILRSNGTNNVYSTSTFADTYAVSTLLYASSANTVTGLATVNSAILTTDSGGVPIWVASTGSGAPVRATSPTLVTPTLGVASATSINFGGTALANYLESTWTPVVTLVGGAGNTVPVYTTNAGSYTRIGNVVHAVVLLSGDGGAEGAGTGAINISLPITASALNTGQAMPVAGSALNNATRYQIFTAISSGATTATVFYWTLLSAYTQLTGADQNNATRNISLSFWYFV